MDLHCYGFMIGFERAQHFIEKKNKFCGSLILFRN